MAGTGQYGSIVDVSCSPFETFTVDVYHDCVRCFQSTRSWKFHNFDALNSRSFFPRFNLTDDLRNNPLSIFPLFLNPFIISLIQSEADRTDRIRIFNALRNISIYPETRAVTSLSRSIDLTVIYHHHRNKLSRICDPRYYFETRRSSLTPIPESVFLPVYTPTCN